MKLCECGCECPVPIAKITRSKLGHIKGRPIRFIAGHNSKGENNPQWNGGKRKDKGGYVLVLMREHHEESVSGYAREHRLVAEKALGKTLPIGAVVHHHNGKSADNQNKNIVVCEDSAYHMLLHQRIIALKECGHAGWVKCKFCKKHDTPENLFMIPKSNQGYHRKCHNKYERDRRFRAK